MLRQNENTLAPARARYSEGGVRVTHFREEARRGLQNSNAVMLLGGKPSKVKILSLRHLQSADL